MKIPISRQLFLGAALVFFLAPTLGALVQETLPPAPPAAAAKPEVPPPGAVVETSPPEAELAKPAEQRAIAAPAKPAEEKTSAPAKPVKKPRYTGSHGFVINPGRRGGDQIRVMNDNTVGEKTTVSGKVVTVMGDTVIDGIVERDVVSVMGDITINGTVHGKIAAVMGDVTLGPKARVDGDVITKLGELHRDDGAVIGGRVVQLGDNENFNFVIPAMGSLWDHGLSLGRPIGFGHGMGWVWMLSVLTLVLYVIFALVFPEGVRRCGDMLVKRPALTVLTSILALLALPVLFVLLCVTIIGIPVALIFLPIGSVLAILFGRAAIYALVGRALSRDRLHPALAVVLGALIFLAMYLVPLVGLLLSLLVAWLGFGCVVTALIVSDKKPAPPLAPPMSATAPRAPLSEPPPLGGVPTPPMESMGFAATPAPVAATPLTPGPVASPMVSATGVPRAGFWIRVGALFIDGVIIAVCFGPWAGPAVLPILALYGALMWKFRGTTVGGIVCGLQVVRLDDRPLDWATAIVRALACFLSLVVIGLGFVWVAFDDEKQSWHDKIAGTTVVRPLKRRSLV